MEVFSKTRKGSFRINTLKWDGSDVFAELETKWILVEAFQVLPGVYFFENKDDYALKGTDAFYGWKIYLQSLASLLPALVLDPQAGESILDVCAAPGGKTTQIAAMMKNRGSIIALEQNTIRFDKLMHNAKLQGATIIEWVRVDARRYFDELPPNFDRILLDVPCSAEGRILLSNEKSYSFWSLENTRKKAELQYDLLVRAFASLKSGWTLVYSTCTLAPEENEWVITRFLSENTEGTLENIDIGLSDMTWWKNGILKFWKSEYDEACKKTVRIIPSDETEGFFMAKIVKK